MCSQAQLVAGLFSQEKENKSVVAKLIAKKGWEKINKSVGSTILYTIYVSVKPIEHQFLDL